MDKNSKILAWVIESVLLTLLIIGFFKETEKVYMVILVAGVVGVLAVVGMRKIDFVKLLGIVEVGKQVGKINDNLERLINIQQSQKQEININLGKRDSPTQDISNKYTIKHGQPPTAAAKANSN
ncbi:MAG TPA: hypothetical protein VGA53_00655 [Candidatus Paceibacterota bacterium]